MQPSSTVETAAPSVDESEPTLLAAEEDVRPQAGQGENDQLEVEKSESGVVSHANSTAFWLTRRDQITVAVLALAAAICLAFSSWGGRNSDGEAPNRQKGVAWQVDINSATELELQVLKGVGPKLAARIIAERTTKGPFQSVDDLQRVHGFGPRTIEKNRDRLRVVIPRQDQPRNKTDSGAE